MAIRNNYSNFPLDELNALKVTIAHEYYHAIQSMPIHRINFVMSHNLCAIALQNIGEKFLHSMPLP